MYSFFIPLFSKMNRCLSIYHIHLGMSSRRVHKIRAKDLKEKEPENLPFPVKIPVPCRLSDLI